jgi:phosphate transport system protein
MDTNFETELNSLRETILLMASHAEKAVYQSVQALVQRDGDLAASVLENDEILDRLEVQIDEMVILILTKAPLAGDLRLIPVAMKISQNLERIGDEATKIAKCAGDLIKEPALKSDFDIRTIADTTINMLKDALNAFANRDSSAARAVIPRDKEVDALNKGIYQILVQHMSENPQTIGRGLNWIVATKSLERIADHAKNIAEAVVYLCEAADIRHAVKN